MAVSRGYMNRPELTAERFIHYTLPISNGSSPTDRLYKPAIWDGGCPGEGIEFLGRVDNQIKLRGFRIELGEIESRLEMQAEINKAVVAAIEDNGEKIYAPIS